MQPPPLHPWGMVNYLDFDFSLKLNEAASSLPSKQISMTHGECK